MADGPPTAAEQELKDAFVAARGYWSPLWDGVLRLDPAYFEAYMRYSVLPWERGPLEPKVKELIYTAVDISTTHLFEPGTRIHVANALEHGATRAEIMEVFEIASVVGMQSLTVAVPILVEELEAAGRAGELPTPPDERRRELRARAETLLGRWSPALGAVLDLDPDFFEAYLDLEAVPRSGGALDPKTRELVYLAVDAGVTHLHEPGVRAHIRAALAHGATAAEIMEVLELASVLGVHSCTIGVPILLELAEQHEKGRE